MAIKLSVADKRMLKAIDMLKQKGAIRFKQEFLDTIDMKKQNIRQVKIGLQHFSAVHIMNACKAYNINANWVLGLSDEMYNQKASIRFISEGKPGNKIENKKTNEKSRTSKSK